MDWPSAKVTLTAVQAPFTDVAMDLAQQTGLSIVVPQGEPMPVSLEFLATDARSAFELLASQVGYSVTIQDGTVVFLPAGEAVQAIGVYRTGFGTADEAARTLQQLLAGQAKVTPLDDRVVVAGTRAANDLAASIMEQYTLGPDAWLIEVRLVELSHSLRRAVGLDWSFAGNARASINATTGFEEAEDALPVFGSRAAFVAEVIGEASMNSTDAELITHATVYLLEGETSSVQLGQVVPYPSRSVINDQGDLVTRDFERIDTGFTLSCTGLRVPGGLRLTLDPTISEVTGFVDTVVPIVAERSVNATVLVRSGDWVILSGFDQATDTTDASHSPFPFDRRARNRNDRSLHVLVRAVRINNSDMQAGTPFWGDREGSSNATK